MILRLPLPGKGFLFLFFAIIIANLFMHFIYLSIVSLFYRFISEIEAVCRQWLADGPNNLLVSFYQFTSYKFPGMNDMGNRLHYWFC
jgi:hypothetical protein